MNRGKLLIALVVAAVLSIGVGSSLLPANASSGVLSNGVCVPLTDALKALPPCTLGGAPAVPSAPVPVAQPTQTTPTTPTDTTPTTSTTPSTPSNPDNPSSEPNADAPGTQPTTGGKKGDRSKAGTPANQNEGSSTDSGSTNGKDNKPADTTTTPTTNSDGTPAITNPTTTVADVGPAPIGVPNFVIDKFKIPPFLLPIYKAAEAQYNIP